MSETRSSILAAPGTTSLMRSSFFACVVVAWGAVALAGCGLSSGAAPESIVEEPPAGVDALSAEWFAGECAGYCRRKISISAILEGAYVEGPYLESASSPPRKVTRIVVSAEQWQQVWSLAEVAMSTAWEARYGCPDCSDGGGWRVAARPAARPASTTVLDNFRANNPAPLEMLLEAVQALHPDPSLRPLP